MANTKGEKLRCYSIEANRSKMGAYKTLSCVQYIYIVLTN